jgi:hypothetical protein
MKARLSNARRWMSVCGAVAAALALSAGVANAEPPHGPRPGYDHFDGRFGGHGYYPSRGYYVHALPPGRVVVGGGRYFYAGGVWYAPRGPGWVVVGPPVGVFVPVLPGVYTTVYFGGVPYYYANDTYYTWVPEQNQYEVVAPPGDDSAAQLDAPPPPPGAAPPPQVGGDLFVYPKNGQNDQQQATDKFQCHQWAHQQSGFDPTVSGGGVPPEQNASAHTAYNRAMIACLEGRGYSVK